MKYIDTSTLEYPLFEVDIIARIPDTFFGGVFSPPAPYARVYETKPPEYNYITSHLEERTPVNEYGGYYQKWQVVSKFQEYVDNLGNLVTIKEQEDKAFSDAALLEQQSILEQNRSVAKLLRQASVEKIVVTTSAGNTFDGDEISQNRMARAILALQATGGHGVSWVLTDNSVIQASVAELTEALALAGASQAAMWIIP